MTHGPAVAANRFPPRAAAIALVAALLSSTVAPATGPAGAAPTGTAARAAAQDHDRVVSAVPRAGTPDVLDGVVNVIYDAGDTVVVGGDFSQVRGAGATEAAQRPYIFAFDEATGTVDPGFAPALDGIVSEIIGGPTPGTVYVAGRFKQVGADQPKRVKLALLDLTDGSVVETFDPPAFDGLITDLELVGGRLLLGGRFALADTTSRNGLASLDAVTGALDEYLTVALTEHHSWAPGNPGWQEGGIGAKKMALSPDGRSLVVIGNFKRADGVLHDQIVRITLTPSGATVDDWDTEAYRPLCHPESYDSYMRDVAFSPDGSYFVVVSTGGKVEGTLCDVAARWESRATGPGQQPTWEASTGGDTLLSVAISGPAVYVGGHQRWMNNTLGHDSPGGGAIPRPAIAALDPLSGLPLAWNPGINPRGFGVVALHLTSAGLWIGNDAEWIGDMEYQRRRIAFFPLAGGSVPHSTATLASPGRVYTFGPDWAQAGTEDAAFARAFDGTTAGDPVEIVDAEPFPYSEAQGGFLVGGTVFLVHDATLYRQALDAGGPATTVLGPVQAVDPYNDPKWSSVPTEPDQGWSSETYAGVRPDFYREMRDVTGMLYQSGKLYYTIAGEPRMYWRWFNPDSGAIGATRAAIDGGDIFEDAGGMFLFGGRLYVVDGDSGDLLRMDWSDGRPAGTPTTVSGPDLDGQDWRARIVFAGP